MYVPVLWEKVGSYSRSRHRATAISTPSAKCFHPSASNPRARSSAAWPGRERRRSLPASARVGRGRSPSASALTASNTSSSASRSRTELSIFTGSLNGSSKKPPASRSWGRGGVAARGLQLGAGEVAGKLFAVPEIANGAEIDACISGFSDLVEHGRAFGYIGEDP